MQTHGASVISPSLLFTSYSTFTTTSIYLLYTMASTSTTQRLLKELKEYSKSPNEALLHLGPIDEDDLLHWEAVLKGVKGTPYEGIPLPYHIANSI